MSAVYGFKNVRIIEHGNGTNKKTRLVDCTGFVIECDDAIYSSRLNRWEIKNGKIINDLSKEDGD